jgi:hypothetical protein
VSTHRRYRVTPARRARRNPIAHQTPRELFRPDNMAALVAPFYSDINNRRVNLPEIDQTADFALLSKSGEKSKDCNGSEYSHDNRGAQPSFSDSRSHVRRLGITNLLSGA